ncbi:MAG: deoxyguanosinetriphosphate triphosphohydrolase [Candidatus Lumbricidophila eiseniae]|uniref:Deoxyguanosinetriphosphate triphosphohydrolase-like protein n=1 Tax=Candidatus Lumbricidiphila eiseniae TaxID=1969409 RepID=A0A2A6FS85_9MICO|nr:MAG: deoxyguanosinetriphosphate triphosphohydrolase [Candidatus Lumbricidophila eiseniae]
MHPDLAPGYAPADTERLFPEEHFSERRDFARDRARVLHSSALRRLAAKTQVLSPTSNLDFARTRLTHSLEVAQVGRELAASLTIDPDLVDAACLAHDLGHPPFGHNGETALNAWAIDIGGFEGNAQTLRVLTRLEPKVIGRDGCSYGLNLTRASLDASCKYPWSLADAVLDPSGRAKFGYYADDAAAFHWLRTDAPPLRPCIEAQIMDLADDIAYSVHDFEDAIVNGYLDVGVLGSRIDHDTLVTGIQAWDGGAHTRDELAAAFDRLDSLEVWIDTWDGSRLDLARLKNLTSQLIGRFAHAAIDATRGAYPQASLVRFGASMVVSAAVRAEIAVLKGIVAIFLMGLESRQALYQNQREVLHQLADALFVAGPQHLDPAFLADWDAAVTDTARKRVIVDQIASLTDQTALSWHHRYVPVER